MTQPPLDTQKLESWLRQLEAALGDVSVVDRSDIVMEMNSHIRDSYDRGGRSLDEILSSLGEPVQVANRYRMERGMQPVVIPRSQTPIGAFFKWATIGVLGFLAISIIGGVLLISHFFPLVKVDESGNRIKILGGMIDIKDDGLSAQLKSEHLGLDDDFEIRVGGHGADSDTDNEQKIEGDLPGPVNAIRFHGSNGELEIASHVENSIKYKCKLHLEQPIDMTQMIKKTTPGETDFDLTKAVGFTDCKLSVPERAKVEIAISNGDVKLKNMRNPVTAKLDNGRIRFQPHGQAIYTMNAKVTNGLVSGLKDFELEQKDRSGPRTELFTADLSVTNGGIRIQ